MKAAVYCATRNLYRDLIPAVKSLLANSDVDRVYLLIEDDAFPEELPACVETFNVSDQPWFLPGGANYSNGWTWMVLMRAALHRVFPSLDRILSLDVDTIVREDISALWDLSLDGFWLAGALEPLKTREGRIYINCGVMLLNLRQLRETGKGDELIDALNRRPYDYPEQDCIAELCQGGILEIPSAYNANAFTLPTTRRRIEHFAAIPWWPTDPLVRAWREAPWPRK